MDGPRRFAQQWGRGLEVRMLRHASEEIPPKGEVERLLAAMGLGIGMAAGSVPAATGLSAATAAAPVSGPVAGAGAIAWKAGAAASSAAAAGSTPAATFGSVVAPVLGSAGLVAGKWLALGSAFGITAALVVSNVPLRQDSVRAQTLADSYRERLPAKGALRPLPAPPSHSRLADGLPVRDAPNASPTPSTMPGPAEVVPKATASFSPLWPEIDLVDRAQAALREGQLPEALRLLETYESRFPAGSFLPEVRVIRIRALLLSGQRARAAELASKLLAADPAGLQASRIRTLLSEEEVPVARPR